MPAEPRRIKDLFNAAATVADPAERAALLDRECGSDADLRHRLEALLRAHDDPASALERPLAGPEADGDRTAEHRPAAGVGTVVAGRYKLLEAIGEGGMGEVWVADQLEPIRRRVALKLIKPGMDSRSVLGRFEAERQALAVMDHPNIAKVLDAGTTDDGRPYFVMELVKGTPITEFCDARKLTPKQRLELFVPVCLAIQHAHMKGIIHRDIKPSNVLVALHDELPVPKVIDFGVAKAVGQQLTEKTIYTGFGALVGTPAYMAPEQATFNQLDIDTRADVYALGVLLYELLAGSPPIEAERMKKAALDEVLRIVRDEEPPRPSQRLSTSMAKATIAATRQSDPGKLSALMRGELDWIVMKALEKDRTRRYDTANGLAADVQRYLSGEQVQAVPPSLGYRLRKAYRRNKAAVRVASAFICMSLGAAAMGGYLAVRASSAERKAEIERDIARDAERKEAEQRELAQKKAEEADRERQAALMARDEARRTHYAAQMNLAQNAFNANDGPACLRLLDELRPKPGESDLRGIDWNYLYRSFHTYERIIPLPDYEGRSFARFSTDGNRLFYPVSVPAKDAQQTQTFQIAVRDLPSGDLVKMLTIPPMKSRPEPKPGGFDVSGNPVVNTRSSWTDFFCFVLRPSDDGRIIAVSEEGRCLIFETDTGRILYSHESGPMSGGFLKKTGVSLSGNGQRVMLNLTDDPQLDKTARDAKPKLRIVVDLPEGKEVLRNPWTREHRTVLNYDGKLMTYASASDGEAVIMETLTEEVKGRFSRLTTNANDNRGRSSSAVLNRDGTRLRHTYEVVELNERGVRNSPIGGNSVQEVWDVANNKRITSISRDPSAKQGFSYAGEPVKIWDRPTEQGNASGGSIRLLEPDSAKLITTLRPPVVMTPISAISSDFFYGMSINNDLYVWSITKLPGSETDPRSPSFRIAGSKASSTCIASCNRGDKLVYFSTIESRDQPDLHLFSHLTLVVGGRGPVLKSISITPEKSAAYKFIPTNVTFDPSSQFLYGVHYEATNREDLMTTQSRLWRWDTGANRLEVFGDVWPNPRSENRAVNTRSRFPQIFISQDGTRIATLSARFNDGVLASAIVILDAKSGRIQHTTEPVTGELHSMEFSTDGRTIQAIAQDRRSKSVTLISFDTDSGRTLSSQRFDGVENINPTGRYETNPWQKSKNYFVSFALSELPASAPAAAKDKSYQIVDTVRVHDLKTMNLLFKVHEPNKTVENIVLSPDGKTLAVLYRPTFDGSKRTNIDFGSSLQPIKLYSIPEGRELGSIDSGLKPVKGLYFSPDNSRLMVYLQAFRPGVTTQPSLNVYDTRSGRLLTSLSEGPATQGLPEWSRDGRKMMFGVGSTLNYRFATPTDFPGVYILDFSPLPEAKK